MAQTLPKNLPVHQNWVLLQNRAALSPGGASVEDTAPLPQEGQRGPLLLLQDLPWTGRALSPSAGSVVGLRKARLGVGKTARFRRCWRGLGALTGRQRPTSSGADGVRQSLAVRKALSSSPVTQRTLN